MPVDDAPHSRQTDTRPRKLTLAVEPLEGAEQLVRVDHVEPDPVVTDEQAGVTVDDLRTDLDPGDRLLAGELEGVADEVREEDPRESRIGRCGHAGGDAHLELAVPISGGHRGGE